MVLNSRYGFKLNLEYTPGAAGSLGQRLFSETSGRYLVEVTESNQDEFLKIFEKYNIPVCEIGLTVTERVANFGTFEIQIEDAKKHFSEGIRKFLE